jgi:SPP1 family predicted phage head-tail adaptor
MRTHTANELKNTGQVLAADATTVVIAAIRCGLANKSTSRKDEDQAQASETTHQIVVRYPDGASITSAMYFRISGVLYAIDARPVDALEPQPETWLEIDCHAVREGK